MILILAAESDEQARTLAERWQAALVTPADLSKAGWRYQFPETGRDAIVASGQTIPACDITAVLTRLSFIEEAEVAGIAPEDRAYAASEMQAFLAAWLDSLRCPVLNRPTPLCLSGPSFKLPAASGDESGEPVVVVGDQCFGASRAAGQAVTMAREAEVELLEVRFRDGEMVSAKLVPDLSDSHAAAAVYDLLTSPVQPARVPVTRNRPARKGSQILLWGLPADGPFSRVHEELQRLHAPVWVLDQRDVLETDVCRSQVRVRGETLVFDEVRSVYLRTYDSTELPHIVESSAERRQHAANVDAQLTRWLHSTDAFLVSPLDAMSANNSKPYQLRWIAEFGWRIPKTLITTDPGAARAFWRHHGDVIYKSISGIRSRVSRLSEAHESRLDDVISCPTQFQEFIPGTDYRVHVVGKQAFACQVLSQADDYRYAGEGGVEYVACQLPLEIEDRCCRMSASMNLPVSGIDLRLSPEGDWICFEVNPSPGFTAYEDITGQPIAAAIARLLADPPLILWAEKNCHDGQS